MEDSLPLKSNEIRTSKYNLLTFLPLNIMHQLMKPAHFYFICICYLQTIKSISVTLGSPASLPFLIFVMAVSSVKDFFEDRVRQRSDQEENKRLIQVYEQDGNLRTT